MPLVFVHGVANRMGTDYHRGQATRDALFRQFLLAGHRRDDGKPVRIHNPYWGDLGARLSWGGASLPLEDFESLGAEESTVRDLVVTADPAGAVQHPDSVVLTVAHRSLPAAVDLLWPAAALEAGNAADPLAALAGPVAAYAAAHPDPPWLVEVRNDHEFLVRLQREVEHAGVASAPATAPAVAAAEAPAAPEWETLGIADAWDAVRRGLGRVRAAATGVVGRAASDRVRPAVIPSVANFLGDVFVYLRQQDAVARPIGQLVEGALRAAAAERTDGDPLVVVAHSMGGNITYDLLTSTAQDVEVDLLVSAGTQVGFFEELKLFTCSDPALPGADRSRKVPRPANIQRWLNIFDHADVLGFAVGSVIDGVSDFAYSTGSLLKAHSQYFLQPGFHRRLAERVAKDLP